MSVQTPDPNADGAQFAAGDMGFEHRGLAQAMESLKTSEARLHSALRAGLAGTWILDPLSRTVWWDTTTFELWGHPPDSRGERTLAEIETQIHVDDLASVRAALTRALESGDYSSEFRIIRPDGGQRWLASRGRLEHSGDDGAQLLVGASFDITDRKFSEALIAAQNRMLAAIADGLSLSQTLDVLLRAIEAADADLLCSVLLVDEDGRTLRTVAAPSLPAEFSAAIDGLVPGPNAGSCGTAVFRRQSVVVVDIASDPRWESFREMALSNGLRACWSRPIFDAGRDVVGTFAIYLRVPRAPTRRHLELIDMAAQAATIAMQCATTARQLREASERLELKIAELDRQRQRLQQLAHHDALTDLPNRIQLDERMQQAIAYTRRRGELMAVCYLDLDGFKPVNDRFGHAAGDQVLIEVARRLRACVRDYDCIARLGGDEFVLLLCDLQSVSQCQFALDRVLEEIASPYLLGEQSVHMTASIGVSLYPSDGGDPDQLLRQSDQALFIAKREGRSRYAFFDAEQDRRMHKQRIARRRIEAALTNQEFCLQYEPCVNLREQRVVGAEALLRWQHPERGLLRPADFLSQIEDTELIEDIGSWVIETALTQAGLWRRDGLAIELSVNVAARQLQAKGFATDLHDLLGRHPDVPPQSLVLEILETAALHDISEVSRIMRDCQSLGLRFALDDFGTGYSSLSYLRLLPAEILKVDRSFVCAMLDNPNDYHMVHGVVALAHSFDLQLVAEGVERTEQGAALLKMGCDQMQGYGIARPMDAQALPVWIEAWNARRAQIAADFGLAGEELGAPQ